MIKLLNADVFERECVYCHKMLSVSLKDTFFKYLLRYSSEKPVKSVMFYYLKNPSKELSVMPKEYIKIFGIKQKTDINDTELKKAIDIYWEKYKVFGKLK
jgi:hypothetical protein